ncbi:MAG TPA: adenylate/guanylate cyclase domain-containing protein [Polyangiaceae bacterium]|nr:adenylate/guanylate cyclase domain-containing protein [Polyangiaceae bacterium]
MIPRNWALSNTEGVLPVEVNAILEAERQQGEKTTFIVRLVIGGFGIINCLALYSSNTLTTTVIGVAAGLVYLLFSGFGLAMTRRGIHPPWLKYAGVVGDMTVVTVQSIASLYNHSGAYETLLAPIFGVLYVMFNILTGLQYSARLSLFAAGVAAIERAAVLGWVLSRGSVNVSEQATYGEGVVALGDQVMIVVFIAFSGVLAAWVSRNARRLLVRAALDAVQRRELERRQAHYRRYLSAPVLDQVLKEAEGATLGGERQQATILVVGIHDFSSLTESRDPESVVALLNTYLSDLVEILFRYGGTLDRYSGQGLSAIFGVPYELADAPGAAVRAALEMHERMRLHALGRPTADAQLGIHVGIAQGTVVAGNIGSVTRMEFTVIGQAVTRAERLQAFGSRHGIEILVDEAVHEAIQGLYHSHPVPSDPMLGSLPAYAIDLAPSLRTRTMVSAG